MLQLFRRVKQYGISSLFRTTVHSSAGKSTTDMSKGQPDQDLRAARSSTEMNRHLIKRLSEHNFNGQHGEGAVPVDEIALNNIYQRKDLSVMEAERQPFDRAHTAPGSSGKAVSAGEAV